MKKLLIIFIVLFSSIIGLNNIYAQGDKDKSLTQETEVTEIEEVEEKLKCIKTGQVCASSCKNKKTGTCCNGGKTKKSCSKEESKKCSKSSKKSCSKESVDGESGSTYKKSCCKSSKKSCSKEKSKKCCKSSKESCSKKKRKKTESEEGKCPYLSGESDE